jgi:hypothetical protein
MDNENPYRAPSTAEPPARHARRPLGPIAAGLVAIALGTIWAGGIGLLASSFAVGSWWLYKFWPRPTTPEDAGARAYLQKLESPPREEVAPAEVSGPPLGEDTPDVLRDLRI